MSTPLRLVFLGADVIALPLLDWLVGPGAETAQLVGVFTQPDRPVGRGQQLRPHPVKVWAETRGLPVHQPEKLTEEARQAFAALRPDVGLVMAYGHILREDFLQTPRLGLLNLHTSLLPQFRGASPIQSAMASGVTETGVTLMRIVRRLDAGPVADVERVAVGPLDTAAEVEARLGAACVPLLARTLPRLADGSLVFTAQDDAAATYCRKLAREDGVLDFSAPAALVAARVNALYPWPGCTVEIQGQTVKLGLADVAGAGRGGPGEVLGQDGDGLLVAAGGGAVRLRRLQRPGGRMLPAAEFLRGFPVPIGTVLPSRPMAPLVTTR